MFGDRLDLHSGGIDLAFPHHTNEIALCEGHRGADGWAGVFMHSGHVHIEGLKMSKSLKNFVTIREVLRTSSADDVRMFCLAHGYRRNVEFSAAVMAQAQRHVKRIKDTLWRVHSLPPEWGGRRRQGSPESTGESPLAAALARCQAAVDAHLRADLDTPAALQALLRLTGEVHDCLDLDGAGAGAGDQATARAEVLAAAGFLEHMGCVLGFSFAGGGQGEGADKGAVRDVLGSFRARVRQSALRSMRAESEESRAAGRELLGLCDEVRGEALSQLDVALRDEATKD